ncbi:MAG TPA: hypothetical protein V6D33_12005 [Cyanophyceae cyanobacterium]
MRSVRLSKEINEVLMETMERELPKPGDRWRHYKLKDGVEYIAHVAAIAVLWSKIQKQKNCSRFIGKTTNG